MPAELNNPMRFGMSNRTVKLEKYGVKATDIDIRPSEGNIYVHWKKYDEGR